MPDTVIVACIGLIGSLLGSLIGVITSNKLTQYRIDKLEESVNSLKAYQTTINELKEHNSVQDQQIKNLERLAGI